MHEGLYKKEIMLVDAMNIDVHIHDASIGAWRDDTISIDTMGFKRFCVGGCESTQMSILKWFLSMLT